MLQVSFGPAGDGFSVSLHTTPVGRPCEDGVEVGPGSGAAQHLTGAGGGPAADAEEEARSFWTAELDMLRCGAAEGAAVAALEGPGGGAPEVRPAHSQLPTYAFQGALPPRLLDACRALPNSDLSAQTHSHHCCSKRCSVQPEFAAMLCGIAV